MRRRGWLAGAGFAAMGVGSGGTGAAAPMRAAGPLPAAASRAEGPRVVRIGTSPGPHAEILAHLRTLVAPSGLDLRLDVRPGGRGVNADVARGALEAACFEDGVAFADDRDARAAGLVVAAPTVCLPMGLYSRTRPAPAVLRAGDAVLLPTAAAARARALVLLHNFGLLGLRDGSGLHATLQDVVANARGLRLGGVPWTAEAPPSRASLLAVLDRAAVVALDFSAATSAGLQPARDAIGLEDGRSPFAGVLAVRRDRAGDAWLARLLAAYRGAPMKAWLLARWQESVRRPW